MIITKLSEFKKLSEDKLWVVDLETKGTDYYNGALIMGIGFFFPTPNVSCYVPIREYDLEYKKVNIYQYTEDSLLKYIADTLPYKELVCHNALFDIGFLRSKGIDCKPSWCTMVGWHLLFPEGKKVTSNYSLDSAIEQVLGKVSHKEDFAFHIKSRGGSVKNGDHYMADLKTMASYCENDCKFTYELYQAQKPVIEKTDSLEFLRDLVLESHKLVWKQKKDGISFDVDMAKQYLYKLLRVIDYLEERLHRNYKKQTEEVSFILTKKKIERANYKKAETGQIYLDNKEKWVKFNFNSDDHLRLLFNILGIKIKEFTDTGKVSLAGDVLLKNVHLHPIIKSLADLITLRTKAKFVPQYINVTVDNVYRPDIDLCGTASGRIAAYSPNVVAINRRDTSFMKCFKAREGYTMIQYDFSNIEPRIEATFTQDEELKDIVTNNKDMYLELCKYVFPDKVHLYSPDDLAGSKKRLQKERNVLKTVRLGLGYGMGAPLLASKIDCSVPEARRIFKAYWDARYKAKNLENNLLQMYALKGYASNLFMRPIIMGNVKDILNRMIQSSAHDTLTYFSIKLYDNLEKCGIHYHSILPDIHDEGIYECKDEDVNRFLSVLYDTLDQVNRDIDPYIPLEIEHKLIKNFAELGK